MELDRAGRSAEAFGTQLPSNSGELRRGTPTVEEREGGRERALTWVVGTLVAAAIFTWPLVVAPTSHLPTTETGGDAYLNLWILGWDLRTLSTHPLWALTGRIFDANIFYPATGTLGYSDHLVLQAIALWPLYAVTHDLVLCYNVLFVASLVLSAWAMFAFVRTVTGTTTAGVVAGFIWGFCPYRFTQLSHIQLQSLYWMPLTFLFLYRVTIVPTARNAIAFGALVALQTVSSIYLGLIGAVGLAVGSITVLAQTGRWRSTRAARALAIAALVAVVAAAPGVWPYWMGQRREGLTRTLADASHHSAVLASYVQAPVENWLYGHTGWLRPLPGGGGPLGRRDGPEQALFPGFVVIALAALGFIRARAMALRRLSVTLALVGVAGLVLSLGPDGISPIYAAAFRWVFGFHAIRAPARFSVLVLLALAGLAGVGVASLTARSGRPSVVWLATLLVIAIGVEFLNGSIPWAPAPPLSTPVGRWLAEAPEPGPVIYLPLGPDIENAPAMVASLEHGRQIVNGYSGQRPAFFNSLVDTMTNFPSAPALLTLRELGVRFVVASAPIIAEPPLVERARFGDAVIYELRWTPEIEASVTGSVDGPPPPPGRAVPFAAFEQATYRCRWLNGPVALSAGEAVIGAASVNEGFRLTAEIRTAEWVGRFFDAHDTLQTNVDRALLPTTHRQELNEGRRHLVRTLTFDRTAHRVILVEGDRPPVTMPLTSWARDPIAALYYARTLPLAPGFRQRIPVTDAGRELDVDVEVVGFDTVTIDGRKQDALRIEPRFGGRVAFRRPMQTIVWVSRDERHVPLVIRVEADFGAIAAELVDYSAR